MPPNQPYPGAPGPQQQPQAPYQPQPQPQPAPAQQPVYPGQSVQPVQAPNGSYQVLPPLPAGQNNGHSGHNPYEFIVNPPHVSRTQQLIGGNKFLAQVLVIVGGAAVVIIIAGILISALTPKGPIAYMTTVVQRQQEIVRVAKEAGQQAVSQDAKNFVSNVQSAVSSDQQQANTYLVDHGKKLKPKVLAMDQSADSDALLENAATTNTYDQAAVRILTAQLQSYQGELQETFKHTSNKELTAQLQHSFTTAGLLLRQAKTVGTD